MSRTREIKIRERATDQKETEKPSFPFICFDTEDDSAELAKAVRKKVKGASLFNKKVTQIAAITAEGKRFYCAGDKAEFLKWLERQPETFVYALNIQYDLGNLFADVLDVLDCTLVGGRMIKAVWGNKIFVDVWNIWQCSAKKLGETFGIEKLETKSMATDKKYVYRDVEIIRAAMLYVWQWAETMGLDGIPPTMGSLGVKLWKHWGGETVHHSHEMTRDGIYGGRVELFKHRNDSSEVRYCDINSLYPTMMTREFPGELEDTGTELKRFGMAQVTMQIPEAEIMVLPFRTDEGKILYPWGTVTGVWTIFEIREAEKRGAKILEVHNVLSTDEGIFPYRDYMERIYRIRKASKSKTEKNLFKLLMNTLYGRTGTAGVIGRTVIIKERENLPSCNRCGLSHPEGICFGERVLVNYSMPLGEEVNWSHAAHITSYGRVELLKYLEIIGAKNLIYCDTDSVIFDAPGGIIPFPTGSELGEMKVETKCSICQEGWHPDNPCKGGKELENWEGCETFAPKMYKLAEQYKAKGVRKLIPCLKCAGDGCAVCKGTGQINGQKQYIEEGRAAYDLPYKFREAITFYDRSNAKKLSVWHEIEKENRANYDKKIRRFNRYFPCEIHDI